MTRPSGAVEKLRRALGEAEIEVVRAQMTLGDQPRRYTTSASAFLVILFAARAGSTWIGQLLANHPAFGRINEWMNPAWLRRARERHGLADDREAAQRLLDEHGRAAFGFKCTTVGLVGSALVGWLDQFVDRATFIVLRRDPVAQAVSLYRAQLSGRFNVAQPAERGVSRDDFDFVAIAERRGVIETVYANHARALAAMGRSAKVFNYEDALVDPPGFQQRVYAELGLEAPGGIAVSTKATVIGDEINAAWIERFREIERAGGHVMSEPIR